MRSPTVLDLFCGAGGLSYGFSQAGFRILAGVDFDRDSIATFSTNHPGSRACVADLERITPDRLAQEIAVSPGEIDCIVGGPPCQGFSRNRAFRHTDGVFVDDPRNHLYWHFFEHVAYFKPKVVVMENVPEILIKANGSFRDAVYDRFNALGYSFQAKVLNAAEFGVPQRRRRAFFLAGRDGHPLRFPTAKTKPGRRAGSRTPTSAAYLDGDALEGNLRLPFFGDLPAGPSVWDAIADLFGSYAGALHDVCGYAASPTTAYQTTVRKASAQIHNHFRWPLTERQLRRMRLLGQGQGQLHLPEELQTAEGYGSAYRRLQADAQALTITTWMFHPGSGMFTHPFEDRVITIREAARLQSFGDDFVFSGRYHSQCRQVGNAVAPFVAAALAGAILFELGYDRSALDYVGASNP